VSSEQRLEACRSIKLACFEKATPTRLLLFSIVKPGLWVSRFCVVKNCSPSPCWWVPWSEVDVVDYAEVKVEKMKQNYMVNVKYYNRLGKPSREEYYVYPVKVWEKVEERVSPLLEDKPPRNPGVVFIGPPGTGKTSLLRILPDYLGLSVVEVGAESVLSKWVGESEHRFARLFARAEQLEPSLMLVDEGDWLLSPAREAGGYSEVSENILGIVKRKLADFYKYGRKILVAFSANIAEANIDSALKRDGRCGKPIVIPLPDDEAIYSYLTTAMGFEPEVARKMSLDAVNAGLSMADVVSMAHLYLDTGHYRVEPMKYRGYRRYVVPADVLSSQDVAEFLDKADEAYGIVSRANYKRTRIWVSRYDSVISLPLVSALIGLKAKKPIVVIDDEKYLDEAIDMINLLGAVAVVYTSLHPEAISRLWRNGDFPIFFIGSEKPQVEVWTLDISQLVNIYRTAVAKIVASAYNVELSEKDLASLKSMQEHEFIDRLRSIALTGGFVKPFRSLF
jgi:hypothetical protein